MTAAYNVDRYLAEFIDSIEQQTHGLADVEVIAVDDGSTDDTLVVLKQWAVRRPDVVTVLSQPNAGQGAARNLGMQHARGEWITMPDPDDILDSSYLERVATFLDAHPEAVMVATNRILRMDTTGAIRNSHPLRRMFRGGNQLVDLDLFPDYFHGSAAAAFVRRDVIDRAGLRFDVRIRPNFEDGHFCARYLLAADSVLVGFLRSARYLYRKRADGSSTLDTGLLKASRFTDVPRYGYLDVLTAGAPDGGYAPEWLQNFVIYELGHYFSADGRISGATAARDDVAAQFIDLLRQIAAKLDPEVIESYGLERFDRVWRDVMLHGLSGQSWSTPYAVVQEYDEDRKQVRVAYRFTGRAPDEQILHRGKPIQPEHGKIITYEFFDHPLLFERVAWLPVEGTLRVVLNGHPVRLLAEWQPRAKTTVRSGHVKTMLADELDELAKQRRRKHTPRQKAVLRLARSWPVRWVFRDAWVLMDRVHDADDNGERLFRYLRDRRGDVNAWFVVERGTPDWERLRRDGFGSRVVAHGGVAWRLLMLNCIEVASSHADVPVHRPPAIVRLREPGWKFSFLQHGVIKDDLSRWLNRKRVDLFVTSTPGEQESIAGDYTHYVYTSKEARMTGLPRFDRLLELGSQVPVEARDLVLVCPTWRSWLMPGLAVGSQRRAVHDDFLDTDYVRQWLALLSDQRLRDAVAARGLRLAFLPHPNIQPALPLLKLPDHVQALTFAGQDVQAMMARAAVMVTDYSSMAFNAAYLDRPVVYFQFDAALVNDGAHVGRAGYFQYERDGFGPVTDTVARAVDEVCRIVTEQHCQPAPDYQVRIADTFPQRDGRCCERTTRAIEATLPPHLSGPRLVMRKAARSKIGRRLLRQPAVDPIVKRAISVLDRYGGRQRQLLADELIESIEKQTHGLEDVEVIAVDDGSTGNPPEAVEP